ncbi:hypothetical protein TYRP_016135 [Tyrophagus putrescentiae]|nr:hypothetical protein TYRP_016135 [Tyrophagus putrescentiae]
MEIILKVALEVLKLWKAVLQVKLLHYVGTLSKESPHTGRQVGAKRRVEDELANEPVECWKAAVNEEAEGGQLLENGQLGNSAYLKGFFRRIEHVVKEVPSNYLHCFGGPPRLLEETQQPATGEAKVEGVSR